MRRIKKIFQAGIVATLAACSLATGLLPARSQADTANAPSLVISQLKITSSSGQFVSLYNTTNSTLDMSKYQLEYFNSYDLTKATSSKLIALSGTLPPHSYFMVNDSSLLLCYQLTVDSVSLGLSSTAGMIEVLAFDQSGPGGSVSPAVQDFVSWSKSAAAGAQTLPSNTSALLQRIPMDSNNNPLVVAPGAGSWQSVQPSATNACNMVASSSGSPAKTGLSQLLPATEPPVAAISSDGSAGVLSDQANLPDSDVGLMAPVITEILPNPLGSGSDATDEFIEMYNPNVTSFDLGGFSLVAGTTTLHSYVFPSGAQLPAQSFTAFYTPTTKLSLSNSGGQVQLLAPDGSPVATTAMYGTAEDGQAWALANGSWYWTTSPTPGSPNSIKPPTPKPMKTTAPAQKATSKTKAAKSTVKAKAAKSAKTKLKTAKTKNTAALASTNSTTPPSTPIHTTVLALVAVLALLYAAYEYRADIGNRIYQLRQYLKYRRANRTQA